MNNTALLFYCSIHASSCGVAFGTYLHVIEVCVNTQVSLHAKGAVVTHTRAHNCGCVHMKVLSGGSLLFDLNLQTVGRLSMQIVVVPLWNDYVRQTKIGSQVS
jgi:hypothetical protein